MRIPSTPRRTGARTKPIHFQYVPTEKGQQWEGYIAGPTWWGPLHMTRPSKPCVWEVSGHAIPCRFCGGARPVAVVKGWVPLYRYVDNEAVCVPVDEAMRDVVDALPLFRRVVVGRVKGKGASVYIRASTVEEPKWQHSAPERMREADVTESLLVMWDVAELTTHFTCLPSDNAVSLNKSASPAPTPGAPAAAGKDAGQRYVGPDRLAGVGVASDEVAKLLRHVKEVDALKNGNGKPHGEGE